MDFGNILSRAWQIIWKHKVLWIFGILAGCGSAGGNNTGYNFSRRDNVPFSNTTFEQFFERFADWQIALFIIVIVLLILLITLLVIFLSTIGKIGLIQGTWQVEQGKEKLNFGELFSNSSRYFWRVFLLNLIVGLVVAVAVIAIAVGYVGAAVLTLGILGICLLPVICLLAPLGWLLSLVLEQAIIAIVVEDKGISDGFQRGWQLFRKNIGSYLLMGLILLVITLVVSAVLGLPILLIVGPAVAGAILGSQQAINVGLLIALGCCVLYLPVLLIGSGILTAFTQSTWTLMFMQLSGKETEIVPEAQSDLL